MSGAVTGTAAHLGAPAAKMFALPDAPVATSPSPPRSGLARSTGVVLLIRIVAVASGLLFTSALSHLLSPADYGLTGMLVSLILLAGAVGEFGQGDLMAREVSRALAIEAWDEAKSLASASTRWVSLSGSVIGIGVVGVLLLDGQGPWIALAGGLMTVLLSINGSWTGIARAHGHFATALVPREILWRGLTVGSIALLVGRGFNVSAGTAVLCLLCALVFSLAVQRISLGSEKLAQPVISRRDNVSGTERNRLMRAARDIAIINLGGLAFVTLDVVLVGALFGTELAAQYYPANRIAILTFTGFIVLHMVVVPRMARAIALERFDEVRSLARGAARIATGGAILAIGALVLGKSYLHLVVATATDLTWTLALILSSGFLFNAALGFSGSVLIAAGFEADVRRIMGWAVSAGTIALVLAALTAGVIGVAITVVAISIVRLIAEAYICHRRLGFVAAAL